MTEGIPFSEYMQDALYGPSGYYRRDAERFGPGGDFYTSAQVSSLYGALWAHWLGEHSGIGATIVEAGCGDGHFMRGLMAHWAELNRGPLLYVGIDVSTVARRRTEEAWSRLCDESPGMSAAGLVVTAPSVPDLVRSHPGVRGASLFFGNEVLDALPCDVVRVSPKKTEMLYVCGRGELAGRSPGPYLGDRLATFFAPAEDPGVLRYVEAFVRPHLESRRAVVTESLAGMTEWLRVALRELEPQRVAFADYGGMSGDIVEDGRPAGSLRAYRGHRIVEDWLDFPGDSDLTCDVNFTAVSSVLEEEGWRTDGLFRQGAFFTQPLFVPYLTTVVARDPNLVQGFKHLVLPGGLGDRFLVFLASRKKARSG